MITLKLTHGKSHSNGFVTATERRPYVTVEDEAVAKYCVDGGYFEIVEGRAGVKPTVEAPADAVDAADATADNSIAPGQSAGNAAGTTADDEDELEAMTVSELKAYAETVGIDLGKLNKKSDIVAAIRKAEAE